jgi:aminoglycoside phosphotransferase (APT) family kinase protein
LTDLTSAVLSRAPLAAGRTAELYPWEGDQVLKLFHAWFPAESVEHEAQLARAVAATGLPVPAVGEILPVGDRLGLVYERVDGRPMVEELAAKPWTMVRLARLLADLQAEIHAHVLDGGLPSLRRRLARKIEGAAGLDAGLRSRALAALASQPDGDRLCHGDLHPGQVMLTANGAVVVDWIDAAVGDPAADLARTSVILRGARAEAGLPWRLRMMAGWYHQVYLKRALQLGATRQEVRPWVPIVAAARMDEGIEEIQGWLREQAARGLSGTGGRA